VLTEEVMSPEVGCVILMTNVPVSPEPSSEPPSAMEHRAQINRLAQKRFRQRQKVGTHRSLRTRHRANEHTAC